MDKVDLMPAPELPALQLAMWRGEQRVLNAPELPAAQDKWRREQHAFVQQLPELLKSYRDQ
ncbi:MAG: hypothetical protein AB7K24_22355, partial [Gemmataceae bacterium]